MFEGLVRDSWEPFFWNPQWDSFEALSLVPQLVPTTLPYLLQDLVTTHGAAFCKVWNEV